MHIAIDVSIYFQIKLSDMEVSLDSSISLRSMSERHT